jgi:hypothetical protein
LTAFLEIASMGCFSFKDSQPGFEDWLRNFILLQQAQNNIRHLIRLC